MNSVFLDTVGILAILDEDDQWHEQAAQAYKVFADLRRKTLTTEFVLLECGNALARRTYRSDIDDLRHELRKRNAVILVDPDELAHAWQDYRRGDAGDAGIVDHVSFLVMRRLGITDAFTNDRHLARAGFVPLF